MGFNYLFHITKLYNTDHIGGKGKNLFALWKKGFSVPNTYFITEKAYESFMDFNNFKKPVDNIIQDNNLSLREKSEMVKDLILQGKMPEDIFQELRNNEFLNNSKVKLAVRSSADMEDLDSSSFAGMYESYLDITGLDSIVESIKKCWASLWSERAVVYREAHRLNNKRVVMAVIIQRMVDPVYSGVIFTTAPDHKKDEEMFLEYCQGLGERLISGKVSPYTCIIKRNGLIISHLSFPEGERFPDEQIRNLASLALNIEKRFGYPQDIEWTFAGGSLYILQARPITTKSYNQQQLETVWTRANVAEVIPNTVTPLTWSIFKATISGHPELAFANLGRDWEEGIEGIKLINGRVYIKLVNFINTFCYLPFVTTETLEKALGVNLAKETNFKIKKSVQSRLSQAVFLFNSLGMLPRLRWLFSSFPNVAAIKEDNLKNLLTWNIKCFKLHIKSTAYAIAAFAVLSRFIKRLFPADADNLLPDILIGRENLQTAAQGFAIQKLAEYVRKNHQVQEVIIKNREWPSVINDLLKLESGKEFLKMLETFLKINGCRAAGEFELSVPRWKEQPYFVFEMISKYLESKPVICDPEIRRKKQIETVDRINKSLNIFQKWIFKRLLYSYSEFCTLRENAKYRLMEGYYALRQYFLKTAQRLSKSGILHNQEDLFFLTSSEIVALLDNNVFYPIIADLIQQRKHQKEIWESQSTPAIVTANEEMTEPLNGDLSGIGCSPGIAEGIARVIFDISESHTLRPGEILVTPHTDPGWTPLFLSCKALVTEIGGFLSHGATVAREYGIPAVVNAKEATRRIHTGDTLVVDGTKGTIIIKQHL